MQIISRKEFLAIDTPTLFSKYSPCCFGDIQIKHQTCGTNDFVVQEIASAIECESSDDFLRILTDAESNKTSIEMDLECAGRDGMFDDEQMFAIWEDKDIDKLIEQLQKCKSKGSATKH